MLWWRDLVRWFDNNFQLQLCLLTLWINSAVGKSSTIHGLSQTLCFLVSCTWICPYPWHVPGCPYCLFSEDRRPYCTLQISSTWYIVTAQQAWRNLNGIELNSRPKTQVFMREGKGEEEKWKGGDRLHRRQFQDQVQCFSSIWLTVTLWSVVLWK